MRRVVVAALAVAAVSGVGIAADVVTWPSSRGATELMAYGITKHSDVSVDVLIHWGEFKEPNALQAQLRAAGVPAVCTFLESLVARGRRERPSSAGRDTCGAKGGPPDGGALWDSTRCRTGSSHCSREGRTETAGGRRNQYDE